MTLGVLLAVYDGAEVLLKPVFGTLADRIGPRPVLLGGLLAFAVASAGFVVVGNPALLGVVRFGQGAAAAAFSPAAGAMVARLSPGNRHGRVFGGYGAFKSLGYATGPVVGGLLITAGGYTLLFATLAGAGPGGHRLGRAGRAHRAAAAPGPANRARPGPAARFRELPATHRSPWPARPPHWPSGWGSSPSSAASPG